MQLTPRVCQGQHIFFVHCWTSEHKDKTCAHMACQILEEREEEKEEV